MKNNIEEKLHHINAFVFDVDGVLTDGGVFLIDKVMSRKMNTRDGFAMQYAVKKDYKLGIITGGSDQSVVERLNLLGITDIYLSSTYKWNDFEDFIYKYGLKPQEVLYVGDDLPDYEVMSKVGVAIAPSDACDEIKAVADYISEYKGGEGCVRDAIEMVMKAKGDWDYLDGINDLPASI